MRSAFACRRTSGPWVSYQYLWNSSRERLGRRRRGKTSFSIGNLLGRHWTAALLDRVVCAGQGRGRNVVPADISPSAATARRGTPSLRSAARPGVSGGALLLGEPRVPLLDPRDQPAQLLELVTRRRQARRERSDHLGLFLQRDAYELWSGAGQRAELLDTPAHGDEDTAIPRASEQGARTVAHGGQKELAGGSKMAAGGSQLTQRSTEPGVFHDDLTLSFLRRERRLNATSRLSSQGRAGRQSPRCGSEEPKRWVADADRHAHGRCTELPARSTRAPAGRATSRPRMVPPVHLPQPARRHVRVDLRRPDVRVPEQRLHDAEVGAPGEEMRRERVAQRVRRDAAAEAGGERATAYELPHRLARERPP